MPQISQKIKTDEITIPPRLMNTGNLVIVQKENFEKINKENLELKAAFRAVILGEQELREGKTRSMKDFLKSKFPEHAKNY